jgi:hypothetical protein
MKKPRTSVCVEIPDCRMVGSITLEGRYTFILGWPSENATFLFKRRALERFIRLAADMLAELPPDGSTPERRSSEIISSPS